MIDITSFDSNLHLTLILIAAVFTLVGVHMLRFVLAGRTRAFDLEEVIDGIRIESKTKDLTFKNNLVRTTKLIQDIQEEVSSGYDDVVISDLTDHEVRTIKAAQDSQRRRDKINSCLSDSNEIDSNISVKLPRNSESIQEVNSTLMKIQPAISEFHSTIMMMREEQQRNESLNETLNRIENTQASTERSLVPIHQRYKR